MASAQKKAEHEGRTLNWIDEAGFYLLPALVRTWAPVGEPPIMHAPWSYDHLSTISAITPNGQLLLHVQEEAYHGYDVVGFLEHVLRHIDGKLLIRVYRPRRTHTLAIYAARYSTGASVCKCQNGGWLRQIVGTIRAVAIASES